MRVVGSGNLAALLSLRQTAAPTHLTGRVTATMIALTTAAAPLGALAAGLLADAIDARATLLGVGVGALALAALLTRVPPLRRLRELTEPT